MTNSTLTRQRETQESVWRDRLSRHVAGGERVAAFCRGEAVSEASFYQWRKRLQSPPIGIASAPKVGASAAGFIDLGRVADLPVPRAAVAVAATAASPTGLEVHLDFGGGLVLRIVRH